MTKAPKMQIWEMDYMSSSDEEEADENDGDSDGNSSEDGNDSE
jgi:hypothetical protein